MWPSRDNLESRLSLKRVRARGSGSPSDVGKLELPLQGWERKEVLGPRSFEPADDAARSSRSSPSRSRPALEHRPSPSARTAEGTPEAPLRPATPVRSVATQGR